MPRFRRNAVVGIRRFQSIQSGKQRLVVVQIVLVVHRAQRQRGRPAKRGSAAPQIAQRVAYEARQRLRALLGAENLDLLPAEIIERDKHTGLITRQRDLPVVAQRAGNLADPPIFKPVGIIQRVAHIDQRTVVAEHRRINGVSIAVNDEAARFDPASRHGVRGVALHHHLRVLRPAAAHQIGAEALDGDGLPAQQERAAPQRLRVEDAVRRGTSGPFAGRSVVYRAVVRQRRAVHQVDERGAGVKACSGRVKALAVVEIPVPAAVGHDRARQVAAVELMLRRRAVQIQLQREALAIVPRHGQRAAVRRPLAGEDLLPAGKNAVSQPRRRVGEQLEVHAVHARGVGGRVGDRRRGDARQRRHPARRHAEQAHGGRICECLVVVAVIGRGRRQTVPAVADAVLAGVKVVARVLALLSGNEAHTSEGEVVVAGGAVEQARHIVERRHRFDIAERAPGVAFQVVQAAGKLAAVARVILLQQLAREVPVKAAEQIDRVAALVGVPAQRLVHRTRVRRLIAAEVVPRVVRGVFRQLLRAQHAVVDAHAADAEIRRAIRSAVSDAPIRRVARRERRVIGAADLIQVGSASCDRRSVRAIHDPRVAYIIGHGRQVLCVRVRKESGRAVNQTVRVLWRFSGQLSGNSDIMITACGAVESSDISVIRVKVFILIIAFSVILAEATAQAVRAPAQTADVIRIGRIAGRKDQLHRKVPLVQVIRKGLLQPRGVRGGVGKEVQPAFRPAHHGVVLVHGNGVAAQRLVVPVERRVVRYGRQVLPCGGSLVVLLHVTLAGIVLRVQPEHQAFLIDAGRV